ncbi:hypothetical protein K7X08_032165 [Anisodus acutangulus]|uniref:Uncharacterized protein n=1 Tax=Anisodus acutangulus TaxID=402998 RepID=A0A9Q1MMQ5_9SOLA|nr:hypothetical protein K7X08_032165 [Anisodus acutangulus]
MFTAINEVTRSLTRVTTNENIAGNSKKESGIPGVRQNAPVSNSSTPGVLGLSAGQPVTSSARAQLVFGSAQAVYAENTDQMQSSGGVGEAQRLTPYTQEQLAQMVANGEKIHRLFGEVQEPAQGKQQYNALFKGNKMAAKGMSLKYIAPIIKEGEKIAAV